MSNEFEIQQFSVVRTLVLASEKQNFWSREKLQFTTQFLNIFKSSKPSLLLASEVCESLLRELRGGHVPYLSDIKPFLDKADTASYTGEWSQPD